MVRIYETLSPGFFTHSSIISFLIRNSDMDMLIILGVYFVIFALLDKYVKKQWSSFLPKGRTAVILAIIVCIVLCGLMIYYAYSRVGNLGLAADDAWIHQTFARNIAHGYDISFNPGELSTGSSSPLWTYLLSVGFLLGFDPITFSYIISGLLAILCLFLFYHLALSLLADKVGAILVVFILAAQFTFAWDVLSGMEIVLLTTLTLGALLFSIYNDYRWWITIVLLGLVQLTRIEGLFIIIAILSWKIITNRQQSLPRVIGGLLLIGLIVLPIALKYISISGTILPQTFFVKTGQLSWFFIERALNTSLLFLTFPSILPLTVVLPFAVYGYFRCKLDINRLVPLFIIIILTWLSYILILRFGVAYFRYIHHLLPLIIILSFYGLLRLSIKIKRFVIGFLLIATISSSIMNAYRYSLNIQDVQAAVAMAKWTKKHLPANSRIAANDVGALGYFSGHYIVDLIGLINNPMVTRKYESVDDLLNADVHYLVTFPKWYPPIVNDPRVREVYRTALSGKNIANDDLSYVLYHVEAEKNSDCLSH